MEPKVRYIFVIGILCILLAGAGTTIYNNRIPLPFLKEGMTNATPLDALKSQITALQTTYNKLDDEITSQTNRINANTHILFKILNDAPTQTNSITHANVNMDDPSKTPMKTINMS
jgi:hypothetical protein